LDTGLRAGEVFRIRIENIDFTERTIFNPFGKTKAARRKVTMTADVVEMLKRRTKKPKSPFVFPSRASLDLPIGSVRKAHDAAVEKAGIKEHFRLYDLRHPFATRAVCGSGSANPVRDPRTHQHPNDNAVRSSGGGTETLCCRQVGNFQISGDGGSDGKESAGHYNFRYSAMKEMKTSVYNSLKDLVGAPRFELGTSCAQGRRATRLRYAPT